MDVNSDFSIDEDSKPKAIIGEFKSDPYAKNFLLTQILSHDYIDVNNDGPDLEDYGSWTNLHYRKIYGFQTVDENFYKWRSPYTGQHYSKNQISDIYDDFGSISQGEKEVYYLSAVETKSHIAFFVTNNSSFDDWTLFEQSYILGSGVERNDGIDADLQEANNDVNAKGNNQLEYLEKIVLFSKEKARKTN